MNVIICVKKAHLSIFQQHIICRYLHVKIYKEHHLWDTINGSQIHTLVPHKGRHLNLLNNIRKMVEYRFIISTYILYNINIIILLRLRFCLLPTTLQYSALSS